MAAAGPGALAGRRTPRAAEERGGPGPESARPARACGRAAAPGRPGPDCAPRKSPIHRARRRRPARRRARLPEAGPASAPRLASPGAATLAGRPHFGPFSLPPPSGWRFSPGRASGAAEPVSLAFRRPARGCRAPRSHRGDRAGRDYWVIVSLPLRSLGGAARRRDAGAAAEPDGAPRRQPRALASAPGPAPWPRRAPGPGTSARPAPGGSPGLRGFGVPAGTRAVRFGSRGPG